MSHARRRRRHSVDLLDVLNLHGGGTAKSRLLSESEKLIMSLESYIANWERIATCPFCETSFWCFEVVMYCPECGANVVDTDPNGWIWSQACDHEQSFVDDLMARLRRRLRPSGTIEDFIRMEIRGHQKYKSRIDYKHPRYIEIMKKSSNKIRLLRRRLRGVKNGQKNRNRL